MQVTQRTEESARLRYLKCAEVAKVLSEGAHGCKGVIVKGEEESSPGEIERLDEKRDVVYNRNTHFLRAPGPNSS